VSLIEVFMLSAIEMVKTLVSSSRSRIRTVMVVRVIG
jgi:hypothetical protein